MKRRGSIGKQSAPYSETKAENLNNSLSKKLLMRVHSPFSQPEELLSAKPAFPISAAILKEKTLW